MYIDSIYLSILSDNLLMAFEAQWLVPVRYVRFPVEINFISNIHLFIYTIL